MKNSGIKLVACAGLVLCMAQAQASEPRTLKQWAEDNTDVLSGGIVSAAGIALALADKKAVACVQQAVQNKRAATIIWDAFKGMVKAGFPIALAAKAGPIHKCRRDMWVDATKAAVLAGVTAGMASFVIKDPLTQENVIKPLLAKLPGVDAKTLDDSSLLKVVNNSLIQVSALGGVGLSLKL